MAKSKLTTQDMELIHQVYAETSNSLAETARRLAVNGINKHVIFRFLRTSQGLCACGKEPAPNRKLCPTCLLVARTSHSEKRRERKRNGLCSICYEPRILGSKSYCAKHLADNAAAGKVLREERKSRKVCIHCQAELAPTSKQYCAEHLLYHGLKSLNHRFEGNASKVIERDGFKCVICGVDNYRIEVHHIDTDKGNNTPENLVTLCAACHHAITWLLVSANPMGVFQYFSSHYQDLGRDLESHHSPNSRGLQLSIAEQRRLKLDEKQI